MIQEISLSMFEEFPGCIEHDKKVQLCRGATTKALSPWYQRTGANNASNFKCTPTTTESRCDEGREVEPCDSR